MLEENKSKFKNIDQARSIFVREALNRITNSQVVLQVLQSGSGNAKVYANLAQLAHTLKGTGQMVGLKNVAEPAAEMEVALQLVQDYDMEPQVGLNKFLADKMLEIKDELSNFNSKVEAFADITVSTLTKGKRVLLVDDDYIVTELLRSHLESQGLHVDICHDIMSAEAYLQLKQPDLIVLDIILPDGDGIDFCRRIRLTDEQQIIPIVFLSVKNKLQDKLVGFATGADDYLAKPFEPEELVARIKAIMQRMETLQDWALRDELTGIYNRRYLYSRLQEETTRARRRQDIFSLALIDVDHFKEINDQHGHLVGDETLCYLVKKLTSDLRLSDVICRYGGDEFIILLPDTSTEVARKVLERLRREVSDEPFVLAEKAIEIPLTISAGVVGFPEHGNTSEQLLEAADRALYQAKNSGRNAVLAG